MAKCGSKNIKHLNLAFQVTTCNK